MTVLRLFMLSGLTERRGKEVRGVVEPLTLEMEVLGVVAPLVVRGVLVPLGRWEKTGRSEFRLDADLVLAGSTSGMKMGKISEFRLLVVAPLVLALVLPLMLPLVLPLVSS